MHDLTPEQALDILTAMGMPVDWCEMGVGGGGFDQRQPRPTSPVRPAAITSTVVAVSSPQPPFLRPGQPPPKKTTQPKPHTTTPGTRCSGVTGQQSSCPSECASPCTWGGGEGWGGGGGGGPARISTNSLPPASRGYSPLTSNATWPSSATHPSPPHPMRAPPPHQVPALFKPTPEELPLLFTVSKVKMVSFKVGSKYVVAVEEVDSTTGKATDKFKLGLVAEAEAENDEGGLKSRATFFKQDDRFFPGYCCFQCIGTVGVGP